MHSSSPSQSPKDPYACPKCGGPSRYEYPDEYICTSCRHTWGKSSAVPAVGTCPRCGAALSNDVPTDTFTCPNCRRSWTQEFLSNTPPVDVINAPPHYRKHPSGVECITIVQEFSYNRGNVIKYIWRAGEKGDELEDLRKAAKYLEFEIARIEALRNPG